MSYSINDRIKMICCELMEMHEKITLYADAAFQYDDSEDMSDDLYDLAQTIYSIIEKYYPDTDRKI